MDNEREAIELFHSGASLEQVVSVLGISRSSAYRFKARYASEMERRRLNETSRRVWGLHDSGMPPTSIDRTMGLAAGTARELIVGEWTRDKLREPSLVTSTRRWR